MNPTMNRPLTSARALGALALAAVLAGLLLGCGTKPGTPPPATYPVTGQVISPTGQALAGGAVQFQSQTDRALVALGDIGPDGSFSLATQFEGRKLPGAIEGPHEVTVIPPMTERQDAVPVTLRQPFTVGRQENRFTITLGPSG